jgi:pyridoxamine 5'-phosphate oxidase
VNTLTTSDFTEAAEPFALFQTWYSEAREKEVNDPDAMTLATVDPDGLPDARMVLLKGLEPRGFTFYTNSESAKGLELGGNMKAALVFHWKSLRRQVRVRGPVEMVSAAEADAYFASRPRDSRIGAWASRQSRPLESRFALEKAVAREAARFVVDVCFAHFADRVAPAQLAARRRVPLRHIFTRQALHQAARPGQVFG